MAADADQANADPAGSEAPFRWEGMPGFGAEDFEIRLIYPYGEVVFSLRDARSGRAKEHGVFRFSDHVLDIERRENA